LKSNTIISAILLLFLFGCLNYDLKPIPCAKASSDIPKRDKSFLGGSQVWKKAESLSFADKDTYITNQILKGNVPEFFRRFIIVDDLCVSPDYLSVGSNSDFFRVSLGMDDINRIRSAFKLDLPTKSIVDTIQQEALSFSPITMKIPGTVPDQTYEHNAKIQRQTKAFRGFISGIKKDVLKPERPDRVTIYGWYRGDSPIQPKTSVHHKNYHDYSHGIRLIKHRKKKK